MIKIAPSILAADFSRLGDMVKLVEEGGADLLHIDVMDGHFVPNITFGPTLVSDIRKNSNLVFDVHLMIESPEKYIEEFVKSGADIITVHAEATHHLNRCLQLIKDLGVMCGVALNPSTPLCAVEEVLDIADLILLMSVNPGFGGQKYIEGTTEKIARLKKLIGNRNIDIEVDGGIGEGNIALVKNAGATIAVSGSAVYNSTDVKQTITNLKNA